MLKKQGETWKSGLNNGECKERMIHIRDIILLINGACTTLILELLLKKFIYKRRKDDKDGR